MSFCDLGMSPLANSYLTAGDLDRMERFYPLHAYVCSECFLVQLQVFETPEAIFSDYAYFSSYSESWVAHAKSYADSMIARFGFDAASRVIEIASNDGYLLQFFKEKGVGVLGIEPAANVARVADDKGIPTLVKFFNRETAASLADEDMQADLLLGNNVLAHVPELNEFVRGLKIALKPRGIITMEFPHLLQLIHENQFDTIYHEHFSYLSLLTVERIFAEFGLQDLRRRSIADARRLAANLRHAYGKHRASDGRCCPSAQPPGRGSRASKSCHLRGIRGAR